MDKINLIVAHESFNYVGHKIISQSFNIFNNTCERKFLFGDYTRMSQLNIARGENGFPLRLREDKIDGAARSIRSI